MSKMSLTTEDGVRVSIDETLDVEDDNETLLVSINVSMSSAWSLHVMSEGDVDDAYELELQYTRESVPF